MRVALFRSGAALVAAFAVSVVLLAASAAQAKFTIKKCGRASYAGDKVPVSAHKLSCKRAKKIARHFLKTDEALTDGSSATSPAVSGSSPPRDRASTAGG